MAASQEDLARLLVQVELSQAKVEKQAAAIARAAEKSAKQTETAYKAANSNVAGGFQQVGTQVTTSLRAQQAAAKNLGFQLNDIATQLASGTSPFRVLAQQGGQVVQILNETGGARGAIGALGGSFTGLLNPIGLATIAIGALGAAALTYFTSAEEDGAAASKELDAHRSKVTSLLEAWGEGAPQALVDYVNEINKLAEAGNKMAGLTEILGKVTQPLRDALPQINADVAGLAQGLIDLGELDAVRTLQSQWADLEKAVSENKDPTEQLAALLATLGDISSKTGSSLANDLGASLKSLGENFRQTKSQADGLRSSIEDLANVSRAYGNLPRSLGGIGSPPMVDLPGMAPTPDRRVDPYFDDPAADAADRAATSARKKIEQEVARAAKESSEKLGRAVANQTSIAVDAATQYLGQRETTNRGSINSFLQAGGIDLDAATTAWCAAFVNSALAQVGVTGSGSNVATSFLNWGTKIDPSQVQRGDVLVQDRGLSAGQTGGHVGFATGQARFKEGVLQLQMLSGNAADKVSEDWVNATDVVAKRATDAVQVSADALKNITDGSKAALEQQKQALQDQQAAYEQLGQIATTALNGIANALADGKIEGHELLQILVQIIQQMLTMPKGGLGGLFGGGGGGGGGLFGGLLIPGILHKGGVAGSDGYGHGRAVSPSVFAGAKRYHTGGVAGLQPGEVPAILQRGEVVLPRGVKGGSTDTVRLVLQDDSGRMADIADQQIRTRSGTIIQIATQQSTKAVRGQLSGMIADTQARQM